VRGRAGGLLISILLLLTVRTPANALKGYPGEALLVPARAGETRARFLGHEFTRVILAGRPYFPVAVPLSARPGTFTLEIEGRRSRRLTLRILPKTYPVERLTLPRRMVTFPPEILARVRRELALLRGTLAVSRGGICRWKEPFELPVRGRVSSPFGLRRILNGEPRSPHGGVDFAVPAGTPVRSAQEGRVVLTGEFYLPGRVVILDHGCGVYTYYAHLSRILVRRGDRVRRGEVIGLSGASGRATGPHLHFGLYLSGVKVDPVSFVKLIQYFTREDKR